MTFIKVSEETKKGFIYLSKMYDEKGELVYKIGRCKDFISRMKGYTFKNIIYTMATDDCYKLENDLIAVIKNKYIITAGNEYFKCDDENELIHLIVDISLPERINIKDIINNVKNNNDIIELIEINKKIDNISLEYYEKLKDIKKEKDDIIYNINLKKQELENIKNELVLMKKEDVQLNFKSFDKHIKNSDDLYIWFNNNFEKIEKNNIILSLSNLWNIYKNTYQYSILSKENKRKFTLKNFCKMVHNNDNLKIYIKLRKEYVDGKQLSSDSIIGWKQIYK